MMIWWWECIYLADPTPRSLWRWRCPPPRFEVWSPPGNVDGVSNIAAQTDITYCHGHVPNINNKPDIEIERVKRGGSTVFSCKSYKKVIITWLDLFYFDMMLWFSALFQFWLLLLHSPSLHCVCIEHFTEIENKICPGQYLVASQVSTSAICSPLLPQHLAISALSAPVSVDIEAF